MLTDKHGNRFYTAEEAWDALKVSRSTFEKLAKEAKLQKYRRSRDRRHYYRVEDVEKLKEPEDEFYPVEDNKELAAVG